MDQIVQVAGALLVLAAFVLAQTRRVGPQARVYLLLNVAGASVLAVEAWLDRQWGFLLLEGVWAIVAGWGLARSLSSAIGARPTTG